MIAEFKIGISGSDNRKLFREIYDLFFAGKQPSQSMMDNNPFAFDESSLAGNLNIYKNDLFLLWNELGYLNIKRDEIVFFGLSSFNVEVQGVLDILNKLSFEVASFGTLYPQWLNPFDPYEAPSFGRFHLPHGWACAFKGNGYERLVSKRWLDFGPWKQHHGAGDVQLIQFHQLNVDHTTALEQAREGHELMGISDNGGYIQHDYVYKYDNEGLYDPVEKKIKVIVHGKDIPNRQLLDACAARLNQPLGFSKPIKNIAYIFMEEEPAKRHLHAIWLRELECRAISKGKEIVLTDNYDPQPVKPAWAQS
jgi:hypothetical protein